MREPFTDGKDCVAASAVAGVGFVWSLGFGCDAAGELPQAARVRAAIAVDAKSEMMRRHRISRG